MEINEKVGELLNRVRSTSPLVHNITNYVTVNDCANIILAIGGSPVMADDIDEVSEMASIASALVINIGTLNKRTIESMIQAGKAANKKGIPVILDPVGIGATKLRTQTAEKLINEVKFAVIRGNMAEIKILAGIDGKIKGVDSEDTTSGGEKIALNLAAKLGCVVAITGAKDIISDGRKVCFTENGHKMLKDVTGTGCMTTALIGAFCGASDDYYLSAVAGIASMGIAGEKSQESLNENEGIGTFKVRIFDNIYNLNDKDFVERGKIYEM